jgi:hypothetical protein
MAPANGLRRSVQGLSEAEFRERFGTEEACRKALFAMRWREGLTCPGCGGRGFCELRTRKVFQGNRGKRQVRLTAGPVFQDSKLPLTPWFSAIYHLAQGKNGISSIELGRRLGVKQPTAWLMKHKVIRAMAEREAKKPKLEGRVEIDDAHLSGERTGGKRGRCDGQDTFVAAVETTLARKPRRLRLSGVKGFRKKEVEKLAKRDLAAGTTIVSDGLSCWPAVEKAGCPPFPIVAGQARRRLGAVPMGQHRPWQHQDRDHRHLPSRQPKARPAGPHLLRLPVQPPLSARQHRRAPRRGRRPHCPATLPDPHRGWVNGIIRILVGIILISISNQGRWAPDYLTGILILQQIGTGLLVGGVVTGLGRFFNSALTKSLPADSLFA